MKQRHFRLLVSCGLLVVSACAPATPVGTKPTHDGEEPDGDVASRPAEPAATPNAVADDEPPAQQRDQSRDTPPTAKTKPSALTVQDIRKTVREIASLQLGVKDEKLPDDVALSKPPIGADELDMVELIMELEEEFDILIEDSDTATAKGGIKPLSVEDLVGIVSRLIAADGTSTGTAPTDNSSAAPKADHLKSEVEPSPEDIKTELARPPTPYRRIKVTTLNEVTVVTFVDRVQHEDLDVYQMGLELDRLVDEQHPTKLLLDLRDVDSLSDAAMGKLLMFQKRVEAEKGQLKFCSLQPEIAELFRITRLDMVFEIHKTRATGLRAFHETESKAMIPSHFGTIGFAGESAEDLLALANRVANEADSIEVTGGKYLRWSSAGGAEVWLQLDRDNKLIGVVPHFTGESRVRVGITARVTRPNETSLDGAFHGYANPADDAPASGDYPFVFDLPDYRRHSDLTLPSITTVQIAAFAHEVSLFDSIESYEASQTSEPPLASKSFIPSGLFEPGGESIEPPEAFAVLSGHILKSERKVNDLSGQPFYWALIESYGGTFDVVIHEELVSETPRTGGVVTGSFWLSGRLRTSTSASALQGQR